MTDMTDLPLDARILVAVSGGVDSVYMLHNLVSRGYEVLGVAHFDHMIRTDSQGDRFLVMDLAEKYNLPIYLKIEDIPSLANNLKQSIELVARNARRDFFKSVIEEYGYEWLALGHHADDQSETVLYNFIRGSGVHGLAGMRRVDEEQKIFRPLLWRTKKEIYESAENLRLSWNEDYTNHETDNDRAWFRNTIIPELETRRSGTRKVLSDTAMRFQEISDYMKAEAIKHIENWDFIDVKKFKTLPHILQGEILGLLWEHHHGTRAHFKVSVVNEVTKWINGTPKTGSNVYFGDKKLVCYRGHIFIESLVSES